MTGPTRSSSPGAPESAPTSGELCLAAAAGDRGAWNELVRRHIGLLWAIARSHRLSDADAGDVVQTTWLRLVENLGRLHEPDRVAAWLATTARRECLLVLRRSRREWVRPTEWFELPLPVDAEVDAAMVAAEEAELMRAAFRRLSPRCRELLALLMTDPPTDYAEISARLQMPVGSIGPTRGRCLQHLRNRISALPGGSVVLRDDPGERTRT